MDEDGRKYDVGDKIGGMEVTGVSYQELLNEETGKYEKFGFVYHVQNPSDIEKAPEHGEELTAEQIQANAEAENARQAKERELAGLAEVPQDGEVTKE